MLSLVLLLVGCTHGPDNLTGKTYEAIKKSKLAFEMAYEYRDADGFAFAQPYLEAQKAVQQVREVASSREDGYALTTAETCINFIQHYRSFVQLKAATDAANTLVLLNECKGDYYRMTQ